MGKLADGILGFGEDQRLVSLSSTGFGKKGGGGKKREPVERLLSDNYSQIL